MLIKLPAEMKKVVYLVKIIDNSDIANVQKLTRL